MESLRNIGIYVIIGLLIGSSITWLMINPELSLLEGHIQDLEQNNENYIREINNTITDISLKLIENKHEIYLISEKFEKLHQNYSDFTNKLRLIEKNIEMMTKEIYYFQTNTSFIEPEKEEHLVCSFLLHAGTISESFNITGSLGIIKWSIPEIYHKPGGVNFEGMVLYNSENEILDTIRVNVGVLDIIHGRVFIQTGPGTYWMRSYVGDIKIEIYDYY